MQSRQWIECPVPFRPFTAGRLRLRPQAGRHPGHRPPRGFSTADPLPLAIPAGAGASDRAARGLSREAQRSRRLFPGGRCPDLTRLALQTNEADTSGPTASTWMTSQTWIPKSPPCISPKSKASFILHFIFYNPNIPESGFSFYLIRKGVRRGRGGSRFIVRTTP